MGSIPIAASNTSERVNSLLRGSICSGSQCPPGPPKHRHFRLSRASHAPRGVSMSYIEKQRGKYRARYSDPLGKLHFRTFTGKADTPIAT